MRKLIIAGLLSISTLLFFPINCNATEVTVEPSDTITTDETVGVVPASHMSSMTAEQSAAVEQEISKIVSLLDARMNEVDKVLYVYNYLVQTVTYDKNAPFAHTPYGALVDHRAVCQGYSISFDMIMERIGIPTYYRAYGNHSSNMVQIDGEWYNVDTTYADSWYAYDPGSSENSHYQVPDYSHLLCSDAAFKKGHLSLTDFEIKATSTKYDDVFWKYVENDSTRTFECVTNEHHGLSYVDGNWYYIEHRGSGYSVMRINGHVDSGTHESILTETDVKWDYTVSNGRTYQTDEYADLVEYDGSLYLSHPHEVLKLNPSTGQFESVFQTDKTIYKLLWTMDGLYGLTSFPSGWMKAVTTTHELVVAKSAGNNGSNTSEGSGSNSGENSNNENGSQTFPFTDVANSAWYYNAVNYVFSNSLMRGVSTTEFAPNGSTTRAMMVQIFYNCEGRPSVEGMTNPFTDAQSGWYRDAVTWAYNMNITTGMKNADGTQYFGVDESITREQITTMLFRFAQYKGLDPDPNKRYLKTPTFPDRDSISGYAKTSMDWAINYEIIKGSKENGKTYLNPGKNATRAEIAQIMTNYFLLYVK